MGKKATKAADNMYYLARCEAAKTNPDFSSREKAAELVGIDRTRLARIELDTIAPYPEEVKAMAEAYNTPELCNSYCARECPLGRNSVSEVDIVDFDRLALKVLGSLKDIDTLRASLIAISEDGVILLLFYTIFITLFSFSLFCRRFLGKFRGYQFFIGHSLFQYIRVL